MGQRRSASAGFTRLAAGLAAALVAIFAAGCGGGGNAKRATLLLDFTPNAVHAGIFSAVARGYDRDAGVRLAVQTPSSSADSTKLLVSGRADLAVLDIHDLALAREQGRDLVGVMAIVQRPLASVIAQPKIANPGALVGRTVGVTGAPSDDAVLRSIVEGGKGNPKRVRRVTIGFNAVPTLLAGRVAGATAFWNAEGVALSMKRPGFRVFRVDDYGAPSYPELVVCVTRDTLKRRGALVRKVVGALERGYRYTRAHPRESIRDLIGRNPGLDRGLMNAQLAAVAPAFTGPSGRVGELDRARLHAWAAWEVRFGIVRRPPAVSSAFQTTG
jgi:NitT/TauT family transport system substrate-binding protein/putative hydroxymethylpyrimidine transport system substrate-binding protein